MRVWLNGDLMADPTAGAVTVTDHGFTVGDGVFEAVKTLHGVPFAMTRHLARLERSAAGLGLPAPDLDAVRRGVEAVVDGAADDPMGRLRITFTAGPHPMGSGRGGGPPTLVVAYSALEPAPASTRVVTVPWTRNEHGATAGHLCEGTGSNVFYVVDGELRTPSLASGCLAGVTRALVVEWCGAREVDEPLTEVLDRCSEAFLASTTRDVQAIARWDDRALPAPGPVTQACAETWRSREAETMDP